ncbi:MAG: thiol-disulfide oxidoreductase DCC family protein [Haloarculaceae archaeon]
MESADGDAGDHPVVLFDGVCNLCTGTVQFLVPRDADGALRFAPLQSEVGADLLAACGLDPEGRESLLLVEDGECYRKSEAALRIAAHLDGAWPILRHLAVVPRPIRDAVYDVVARYRYDVFGRKERCMVPTDDLRDRFIATNDDESPAETTAVGSSSETQE